MKLNPIAKYDPSQEVLALDSSTFSTQLPPEIREQSPERGEQSSTSGRPPQQLFIDPTSLRPSETPPSDPDLPSPVTTALQGNRLTTEESATPVVFLKREPIIQNHFVPLQKWEGTVLQVLEDSFFARLVDLTNDDVDEEAEFPMEEVSDADRSLIAPGAVFYWNIGYIDNISGQRTRASVIRFRRLPVWRSEELERAKREAQHLGDLLDWK